MSRPRSPLFPHRMSPRRHEGRVSRSQRFSWDNPDFDPHRADQGSLPWKDVPEDRREHFMDEIPPEAQRRPPVSPDRHRPGHHLRSKEYHRRTPSPSHELGYAQRRRLSPKQFLQEHGDGGGEGRGRGGFREDYGRFEENQRGSHSPQRVPRERLSCEASPHLHHRPDLKRDPPMGWRREDQTRGQARSRDRSPRERFHDQGRSQGGNRGEGEMHVPFPDGRREDLHRQRSPHSDRYAREAEFMERHRLLERPREGFERGPGEHWGPQGGFSKREGQGSGPLIVEHDHGMMNSGGPPQRAPFEDQRDRGPNRYRGPERNLDHRAGSSQERFRKPDVRDEPRSHPVHDGRKSPLHRDGRRSPIHHEGRRSPGHRDVRRSPGHRDGRRSPTYPERSSPMAARLGQDGPVDHRDRGSPGLRGRNTVGHRARGNLSLGGRMEMGPSRNHPHPQTFPQGRPHSPQDHQRPGVRSSALDWDIDPREEESDWLQEPNKAPRWEADRPRGRGRPPLRGRIGPGLSRQRDLNPHWNQKEKVNNMTILRAEAVEEETLTIKVDMNRPMGQNSQLCYSSDRQLSLDLVNVGRQRLDFLPMLEHSGTYRENAVHSGTFAQEIITLVHKVKEYYFRGDGITLNERFSAPQEGGSPAEEDVVEVDQERPTLNRRFNMKMNKMFDTEPLFFNVGRLQPHERQRPLSDPGDLRHDLERRRQERLEGVKVTIPGGSLSQRPLGTGSEQIAEYGNEEDGVRLEEDDEGFSGWSGEVEQGKRWGGNTGPRRGGPFRHNVGAQRRNNRPPNRPGNRPGPMRRQNRNINGVSW